MLRRCLIVSPEDSVAVMLEDGYKGDVLEISNSNEKIVLSEDVEFAHKVSIVDLKKGQDVVKYGVVIGYMKEETPRGKWIHIHNMGCDRGI